jgi:hypothetical protein
MLQLGVNIMKVLLHHAGYHSRTRHPSRRRIGLVFLVNSDPTIGIYGEILTPTVLAGVFLAELIDPAATKFALQRAGETTEDDGATTGSPRARLTEVQLMPWTWGELPPTSPPTGALEPKNNRILTIC